MTELKGENIMKKSLLLLLTFLCLFFSNIPFVNAEEGDSIVYKRNFWFYAQRSHPFKFKVISGL